MFFNNYYPYYNNQNYHRNYYNNYRPNFNNNIDSQKKDTEPENTDTIPFKNFEPNETPNTSQDRSNKFNLFGFSFEIDDLILIGLIILLFLESDKNYALIIILGLILLNVNLGDILKIF